MVGDRKTPLDNLTARCPLLGHLVEFSYCMHPASELPCRRIVDCWHERMDIVGHLENILSPQELERLFAPAPPKISQLLELIAKAKKNA